MSVSDKLSVLRWPESYARLYRDALPAILLDQIAAVASLIAECPNFWLPQAEIVSPGRPCRTPAEEAIRVLFHRVVQPLLQAEGRRANLVGAEWWVQEYQPGCGLEFHFDKDEHALKQSKAWRQPLLSSVLYLCGDQQAAPLGPTVVVEQIFSPSEACAVPDTPSKSAMVFPAANAYLVFDGSLAHGVLGSFYHGKRATMLVNWWTEQPQGICRVSESQAEGLRPPEALTNALAEAYTPKPVPLATLNLPHDSSHPILVDDLLKDRHIQLTGLSATQVLAISHPGFQLYPLDEGQEGLEEKPLVAAAFVPISPESSASSEEDD